MNESQNVHSDSSVHKGKTILVVDDVEIVVEMLEVVLSHMGYKTASAHGGAEGLRLFKQFKPDGVITDIGMPEMNGYQLVREIRATGTTIPIIMVTGYSMFDDVERSLLAGADAHMTKPIDPRDLLDLLNDLLLKPPSELEQLRSSQSEQHGSSTAQRNENKEMKKPWKLFKKKTIPKRHI